MTFSSARRLTLLALAAAYLSLLAPLTPAPAAILVDPHSTGATDVDPTNPSTWTSDTDGYIGKTTMGEIEVNGSSKLFSHDAYLGYESTASGLVTVTGAGSTWNDNFVYVGYKGNGILNINDGGDVSSHSGYIGRTYGSTGQVTVDGSGSTWTNRGYLFVGNYGNGTLDITNSAAVTVGHDTYVGNEEGSMGVINFGPNGGVLTTRTLWATPTQLTGTGTINARGLVSDVDLVFDSTHNLVQALAINSQPEQDITVHLDMSGGPVYYGPLGVGYERNGSLTIRDGMALSSNSGYLGYHNGSTGTATITGVGSIWTSPTLYVGDHGSGTLNITNGGTVIANSYTRVGCYENSMGSINFGTSGGTLTTGSLWAPSVKLTGTGTINTNGLVSDVDLVFDSSHNLIQTLILNREPDQDITINLDMSGGFNKNGDLGVGYRDNGSLTIKDGVTVDSHSGYLGFHIGSMGTATVSGTGSTWNNSIRLYIGRHGNGTLNITDSGTVTVGFDTFVGSSENSIGTIYFGPNGGTLTTGSLWAPPAQLLGMGTINTCGLVSDVDLVFDSTHGLTQALTLNSQPDQDITINLDISSDADMLGAGYRGDGSLIIRDGVTVTSNYGFLGCCNGSKGTAIVTGICSTWNNNYNLYIGSSGNGILYIVRGGTVKSNYCMIGSVSGSTGRASVDGVYSRWDISDKLDIGNEGKGTLNITSGGIVSAASVSINDQSLLAIDVDHGSSLNIESGTGTLINDGTVRILAGIVPAAGTIYTPIAAGTWIGSGTYQAVGGTWNETTHEFTASPVIQAASGQRLAFDRAAIQRVKFDDTDIGWTVGASFLAAETSTALDLTVTTVDGTVLTDLAEHLDAGDTVLGAWDFDVTAGYTSGVDPAYLSFEVGLGWTRDDLEVWHYDGAEWMQFDAWDLTYDGTYASFTVDELSSWAVAPLKETWVPGDCNGDNRVDEDDAATLAAHWCKEGGWADGDFNDDGTVDAKDAAIMAAHWGNWTTSSEQNDTTVPEPGMLATLLVLVLVTMQRARSYSSREKNSGTIF